MHGAFKDVLERDGALCFLIGFALLSLASSQAGAQDLLIRRPDGAWETPRVPGAAPGERLEVRPVPGTSSSAVYGKDGRRLGTVESRPGGGSAFYDREGRRR